MTLQEKFNQIISSIEALVEKRELDIPKALESETGLNQRSLGDVFQFLTDITLARYVRQRRLVSALHLRLEYGLSIEDVCESAGYSDAAAFSKACKNIFGISPVQITKDTLVEYVPLYFDYLINGKEVYRMENDKVAITKQETICGVSVEQLEIIKKVLAVGAVYGLSDEEAEFVYRLSEDCGITNAQAAEFYDDFRLQIENESIVPGMNVFEIAELSIKYSLSFSEAQSIMYQLEKNGYVSLRELPANFFDIYFSDENEQCGWDIAYICEIAAELENKGLSVKDLADYAFHASMFGTDILEVIQCHNTFEASWNKQVEDAMYNGIPEDDTDGFGYKSIWELDEGQESLLDVVDVNEAEDNYGDIEDYSEIALLVNQYGLSHQEARELKSDLEENGFHSIYDLPPGFFDIYYHYDMDRFTGWDIPYVCELAEAMADNHIPMDRLDDVMFLASEYNVDPCEVIENYSQYQES